jgi:cytochrome c553
MEANGCEACHGTNLVNSGNSRVPDLRNIREEKLQAMPAILQQGAFAPLGMPKFAKLTAQDINAIQAYIINTAWAEYERQQSGRGSAR